MKSYITTEAFRAIYPTITMNALSTQASLNNPLFRKDKFTLLIDEVGFRKRWEFKKRVWLQNHKNYYIIAEHIIDRKFAKILSKYTYRPTTSWMRFLRQGMWELYPEYDSFGYKVSTMSWEFFRVASFIIRRFK